MDFHFLLQGIFLSLGLNLRLLPVLPALADGFLCFTTWADWEALIEDCHRIKRWRKVEFTLCLTVELKYPFSPALSAPGPQAFRLGLESTPLSLVLRPSNSLAFLDYGNNRYICICIHTHTHTYVSPIDCVSLENTDYYTYDAMAIKSNYNNDENFSLLVLWIMHVIKCFTDSVSIGTSPVG